MKSLSAFYVIAILGIAIPDLRAQFPNFAVADKVLGASDFNTVGAEADSASGLSFPSGLVIDPASGKLFVTSGGQHRILRFADPSSLSNGANAEAVFGQGDFSGNLGGTTAAKFNSPIGLHIDGSGRLWVADYQNHRVLMFEGAADLDSGATADLVLGQPDFTTATEGTSSTTMRAPLGVFVDVDENLWVADFGNHRVLKFADVSSLVSGAAATTLLGQPDFTTHTAGTSGVKMAGPSGVAVDEAGRLWVADQTNRRILRFDAAATLGDGAAADGVLGQPDLTTKNTGISAQEFDRPTGPAFDAEGTLYLTDFFNNRVLYFKTPETKANGAAADGIIGQTDFVSNTVGTSNRRLQTPYSGLVFDSADALWLSDSGNNRVLRFSPDRSASPPTLKGKVPKKTTDRKLTIKGRASDTGGIVEIRYRIGKGAYRIALGTTSWKFSAKLKPGKNKIEIVVVDSVGNVSPPKRVKVKRI
jgi:sugar lactone lactonase YvrE